MIATSMFWAPVRLYNPLLAFSVALFFALSARFFILSFLVGSRGASTTFFRILIGGVFLVLGWLYFLFVSPLLFWDRPARAIAAITFVGVLLWTVIRNTKGRPVKSTGVVRGLIYLFLFAAFMLVTTLTIIRTGYIALPGDRVTLIINVTGETRDQTFIGTTSGGLAGEKSPAAHHIIIWLPTGEAAADMWVYGDELAVHGKAIRFSHFLNSIGIPNLYALQYAHNGYLTTERQNAYPPEVIPFPGTGPLAVHPWWRPIQERLLNIWASLSVSGSWCAIEVADNESPYYPLRDPVGNAVHKNFLLVLRMTATATSKGSSPLEDKRNATR